MFERFSRSWDLLKASATVLMQDKELMVLPLISSIMAMVVVASFILPLFALGALDHVSGRHGGAISVGYYFVAFLFYVVQYFVIFFFNVALVGAVMIRLDGGNPTVAAGIEIAWSRAGTILGYAVIAATVGIILRIIEERVALLGKIVVALIGAAWTVATYMVVPVLVSEKVGPFRAIEESVEIMKKTWGENLIGQVGLGFAFGLIHFALILIIAAVFIAAALTGSIALMVIVGIIGVTAFIISLLAHSALSGIYSAALYRYATRNEVGPGFDGGILQGAFAQKD